MHAPTISIMSLEDDVEDACWDFTPESRRQFARQLEVNAGDVDKAGSGL